jgi:hypothetical protein
MEQTRKAMNEINNNLDNMLFDMKAIKLANSVTNFTDKQFLMLFSIMLQEHKRRFR